MESLDSSSWSHLGIDLDSLSKQYQEIEDSQQPDKTEQESDHPPKSKTIDSSSSSSTSDSSQSTKPLISPQSNLLLKALRSFQPDPNFHKSGIIPIVHNIVSMFRCGCRLNLHAISIRAKNSEYNPRRFSAVICRIRDPATTALIFSTGTVIVGGARSETLSKHACRRFARIIQKCGFPVKFLHYKINNMVATSDAKFPVRLEGLYARHSAFSQYNSEIFSGLIYRMVDPRVVLLIFASGRVVLTGARSRKDVYLAWEAIYPVLQEFRKL